MRLSADTERGAAARSAVHRLLITALVLGACYGGCEAQGVPAANSLVNKKAPQFVRRDLGGREIDLNSLRGQVVLLNFWATWCAPCQVEMPAFAAWQRQYEAQGLRVVGISMDDDAAPVLRTLARLKVSYPVAMGDAALGNLYGGVLGLPLTYLIDRGGVVRVRFQGETDIKTIEAQVHTLLAER